MKLMWFPLRRRAATFLGQQAAAKMSFTASHDLYLLPNSEMQIALMPVPGSGHHPTFDLPGGTRNIDKDPEHELLEVSYLLW